MRERGVKVDVDKAHQLKKDFQAQEKQYLIKIKQLAGKEVDIWAARQIGEAYDRLGIDYPRTDKTHEPSFTSNWLANSKHEISKYIAQAREINKFHGTFLDSILKYEHNGRIHGEINQLVTVVGLSAAVCLWLILIFNSYQHVTKILDQKSEVSSYQKKVVDGEALTIVNKNHEW
jgi:DNA polymerase I-like protein with 3'-5' exonuclease and polymerase domains